jgi:hypothetical protein
MADPYIVRADIEAVFGAANVAKWADLDNTGITADVAARIDRAIVWASNEIESRFRDSIYALPLANASGDCPPEIVDAAANLAGVWLYENRGVQDWNEETGQVMHRLQWNRRRAYDTLRAILAGQRRIDAVLRVACLKPAVVTDEDQDE